MEEIKRRMDEGETGMLFIVPEQYSHDAERQLCEVCGDSLSLHAETLSFTRLCDHVFSETGCANGKILNKSGQILVMHKALEAVASNLKVFGIKKMRTEILEMLVETTKEFKGLCITAKKLVEAAAKTHNPLTDKLLDIALIVDAYDALLKTYGSDANERLTLLAKHIGKSTVGSNGHIFIDGFTDFTTQEMDIIEELLKKGADVTICLTCDFENVKQSFDCTTPQVCEEIFALPLRTVAQLRKLPVKPINITTTSKKLTSPDIAHIEKYLFDDNPLPYPEKSKAVSVYMAPTKYTECEYAASKVLELIHSGYRWRDIGIMARNWAEYESVCESVFDRYEIPYFSSGKADIIGKPPIALIDTALEIISSGWEYRFVFKYIKTGLLQLSAQDVALLENYVITWKIRGFMWQREWTMPVSGYKTGFFAEKEKNENAKKLKHINKLRLKVTKPLNTLAESIKGESTVENKLRAIYTFITDISLPSVLLQKSNDFRERGNLRLADEYTQLLDIMIEAIDQTYMILGDTIVNTAEFQKLITLVLSQHDVGVIPVSLDAVPLGGMAMSRRRDLRCLIILGATEENLPSLQQSSRVLSDNERMTLSELDINISAGIEERMYREMNMLYSTLTLPSEKLIMIYSSQGGNRPTFLIKRLCSMFDIAEEILTEEEYMYAAKIPYQELLNRRENQKELTKREQLTKAAAGLLYGNDIILSASQADRYYSCPYKHFLQNGLKLEPRVKAEFDAASAGNFMHYILDGVFDEIKKGVGFKKADENLCEALTEKYANKFVNEVLYDFEGKDKRFVYLFKRHKQTVRLVVLDMVSELKKSEFEPYEFEMDISKLSNTHRGYIDRTDGYKHNGKLYMRVIDYKTRKKAYGFDLSDIYYGRDMQMLIYLFALSKYGRSRFGMDIEPAGVLYVPARDVIISTTRNADDDEINKKRISDMRRSGIVVNEPAIIEAMESGEDKKYIPVSTAKDGTFTGSVVSTKQIDILSEHVETMMNRAKNEITEGNIACKPYYKNAADNACTYCEYFAVCRFDEQMGDKRFYHGKIKPAEIWSKYEQK